MCDVDLVSWGIPETLADHSSLARVIGQERGVYRLMTAKGERVANVTGKFRYHAEKITDYPVVGDIVATENGESSLRILRVLPRKSLFLRRAAGSEGKSQPVAANIDFVFLCMALNSDFNLRRMERYVSLAWDSGAVPVVLLTKTDLCSDAVKKQNEVAGVAVGVDILRISSIDHYGIEELNSSLKPGKTASFVGSSGVGKSTLINTLMGMDVLSTAGLRSDGKGRHTTTQRQLLRLPSGALVIDTPGMRELGMWDQEEGLEHAFSEIESLAAACYFRNCSHQKEKGCAIQQALHDGILSTERWQAYLKLKVEAAYVRDSAVYLEHKEDKFKTIAKMNRFNRKK